MNPFGILYNPFSIADALERLMDGTLFDAPELFQHNGLWHSFAHHGSFSSASPEQTLTMINGRLETAHEALKHCRHLFITFGTAWIFRLKSTGQVVANCHKLPANEFIHERISTDAFVDRWMPLMHRLHQYNPDLQILFTVSPVRHLSDGAHENQLSKATLLLLVERLCKESNTSYFPAYELMLDDLRDYRFYAPDMTHPSQTAIDYVWERFSDCFFDEETRALMIEIDKINNELQHRPLFPDSKAYQSFQQQTKKKIMMLQQHYPFIK